MTMKWRCSSYLSEDINKFYNSTSVINIMIPTFFQRSDSHGWLAQARLWLPFAFIGVVHLHRGQRGLLLIHTPKHHHLTPQHHSWGPCSCSGQRWNLAPRLALHIQDLSAIQGHASLTAAPQNINQALVVDRSTVHATLRHGWELFPVQWLHWTHSHFQYRHVSGIKTQCHSQHCREGEKTGSGTGNRKIQEKQWLKPASADMCGGERMSRMSNFPKLWKKCVLHPRLVWFQAATSTSVFCFPLSISLSWEFFGQNSS